jgi:uncharacterized membrane protein (UPF0127 family)
MRTLSLHAEEAHGELLPDARVITVQLKILVRNQTRDVVLGDRVLVAQSSAERRTGLLNRSSLEPGEGLWIDPCEAVHCFGMKFAIDVLYLDRDKKIRKIRPDMKPWRISFCLPARSVLELPAGTAVRTQTRKGDQLAFEKVL